MEEIGLPSSKLHITKGGLYSPFPIPAYQILVEAKQHIAKDVLLCLVSHLGLGAKVAYPSYSTIALETGRSRGSISGAIKCLQDFGFIKKFQYTIDNKKHNRYYLQESCWNHDRMNKEALEYSPFIGRCACGQSVRLGEVGHGTKSYHHWGCGDKVKLFSTKQTPLPTVVKF